MTTLLARGQITIAAIKDGADGKDGAVGPQGPQGEQGYGIVAAIQREKIYTEESWAVWAEIGHTESWGVSVEDRNGCRIGDIFTVSGTATDTGNYHIAYYRSTTDSGELVGVCIAHSISPKGDTGKAGFSFANGKSMFKDLLFDEGYNGCQVYNNMSNSNVKLTLVSKSSDNPYAIAKKELKIETTGAATPGHGGVMQLINSRANAVFVRRIIAKIPKGCSLETAENAMGTGMVKKWLTPGAGTGTFTEYIYMYQCGASGNFSSGGHMYLYGGATATADKPVVWYIASCETYDMTAGSSAQIKSTEVMYATSTSGTSAPTSGWQKNIPTVASGSFLWSRFTVTYMDGSNAVSYNVSKMGDRGPQGPTGAAGKDAVSASFSPAALTFSATTDSNGNAQANTTSGNTATITMLEGSSEVTGTYSITSMVGCTAVISGKTVTVKSIASDTIDGRAISRTSASVTVKCEYNGKTCYVSLPISVSVSAVWGGLVTSQKGLESKYTEVSNKYNALPLKTDNALTQYTSTIKQSAKEISLKVAQTAVGRKNLLPGSALRRHGEGVRFVGAFISSIVQYNGTNSCRCSTKGFSGLIWSQNTFENGHNIKIEKGKTYNFSVLAKATVPISIALEAVWTTATSVDSADGYKGPNGSGLISQKTVGAEWERIEGVFTVQKDAPYEYIQVDILTNLDKDGVFYLSQPMLVEGDEYVGWSLSDEDAEYIGGNLLDNTDTLVQGGNLVLANGHLYTDVNSYKGFPTRQVNMLNATEANKVILQWDLESDSVVKQGQDYMLSFWAKGKGVFDILFYKDGNQSIFVEKSNTYGGNTSTDTYGTATIEFKNEYFWQQYRVHWRVVGSNLPKYVQIRCMKGCDLYVSQPKLEYGATVTEYRATKTDFVEDKSVAGKLLDAGIDIDSREITMTADKTKFRDRNGKEVAVFDENGLNADLINAKHVWAKSEDGKSTVGYFGNYEPDYCKVSDNVYAPLFLGSVTAANARFYVTSTGAIKATAGYIGDFTIEGGSLVNEYDKKSMRLGGSNIIFENTSDGKFDLKMGSSVLSEVVGVNTQGGLYLNMKRNYPTSTTSGSETQVNMGLVLNVSGTMDKASREHPWIVNSGIPNGNHAIFIGQGDIAGFRPMLTKATTSRALSKLECVVVCEYPSTSYITLTLPDDPEIGQYYKIIQLTGRYTNKAWGKTYIKSNRSDKPISRYGMESSQTFGSDWQFQVTEFWYDGTRWIAQWHTVV